MARIDQTMLMKLAGHGAAARIQELEAEIAAIRAAFPDQRRGKAATGKARGRRRRRRGKLSAAGRRAISAAQKARRAKIKAARAAKK